MSDTPEAGRDTLEIANMVLRGARFARVSPAAAVFGDPHLMHAAPDDVNATGLTVQNVTLAGASLHTVTMINVTIAAAKLAGLSIKQATLKDMTINAVSAHDLFATHEKVHANG